MLKQQQQREAFCIGISPGMGNDKGNEAVKSEIEDGEVEPMTDDENVVVVDKTSGVKVKTEGVDDGEREGTGESGKERRKEGSKERERDGDCINTNNRAEQREEAVVGSKGGSGGGGPWNMSEKKECREAGEEEEEEEEEDVEHDENVEGNESEEEEGGNEAETGQRLEGQEVQNSDEGEDDDEDTETADRIEEEEEEKSREEEDERKEAEKDLALTMSSSWAPMGDRGERDRDGGGGRSSFKVSSKSGREQMTEREIGVFREAQSEGGGFKERIRSREDDGEHSKEKSRMKKQRLEPPLLSLSLPDTSLHLASPDGHGGRSHGHAVKSKGLVPSSSENERSFRSLAPTQSQSNGYTNSLSLSLSHPFFHNASCSLTQNSFDDKEGTTCSSRQVSMKNERLEGTQGSHASCQVSYGREQFFHGNHPSEGSHDRSKHRRELPLYQRILQNGSAQFQAGEGTRDSSRSFMDERGSLVGGNEGSHGGHRPHDHYRWKEEQSLTTEMERSRTGHDRHWGIHKDKNERLQPEGWPSPTKTSSLQERLRMAERERRDADAGRELSLSGSRGGFHERDDESTGPERSGGGVEENPQGMQAAVRIWLHEIVSDPIASMAHKLHRVPERFLEGLRKCTQDMLTSKRKRDDFVALQRLLQKRNDLSTDTLHQSHRTQLEILVALKTGIPAFLHPDVPLTTGEMTEIFLGTKCRNVACKSQLPADDCECKICSMKSGFCNACMCVVCSKFDFDSNTCRWIGCDYCLHWCHSDCGIQMGYISSGVSSQGTSENAVMLFRCIGCGQTSELYGFVKDVFVSCCKDWSLEVLARELECVRRIFHRSDDLPGKQLFLKAEQLLVKLHSTKDCESVCASMMKFFSDRELSASKSSARAAAVQGAEAAVPPPRELNSKLADVVRDAMNVMKAPNTDFTDLEKARQALQFLDNEVEEKRQAASEIQYQRFCQKTSVEELENIVALKENEANVLQQKADECRQEAAGLMEIVRMKNAKIEEEYQAKLNKLRLAELEEKRRKWYEEVQAMEKSQRDFSAMKMSMVSDIRELLKKMEAAKAQTT